MNQRYDAFSTRAGFNIALRHFKLTNEYAQAIAEGYNLADMLNEDLQSGAVEKSQVTPIANALLHDKFEYKVVSFNFRRTIESADKISAILSEWNALQMILLYRDAVSGMVAVNPAVLASLEQALPFVVNEYALLYVSGSIKDETILAKAAVDVAKVLNGRNVKPQKQYLSGTRKPSAPPPPPPPPPAAESADSSSDSGAAPLASGTSDPSSAGYRVTPKYSVLVTNELFHNGNVEAWKKIIEAYQHKFPTNEVLIWYESERIRDINTLFKWGKVKNGTPIIFSVAGTNIGGVSKLQRYLFEGASPRFEAFLKGAPNQVLNLF